jgi:signal peptidase II
MKKVYTLIFGLGTFVTALDQWSKNVALDNLQTLGQTIPFLDGFQWTLVHNYGAAFGILNTLSGPIRTIFFLTMPLAVLLIIWWTFVRHFKPSERLGPVAMGLVLGGAVGNLIDRIRFGYVIDFVDWFYTTESSSCLPLFFRGSQSTCHWPVFNVADSAISIAMVILISQNILIQAKSSKKNPG